MAVTRGGIPGWVAIFPHRRYPLTRKITSVLMCEVEDELAQQVFWQRDPADELIARDGSERTPASPPSPRCRSRARPAAARP
jgi:hypothetical protein